jgi:hypothetical protein
MQEGRSDQLRGGLFIFAEKLETQTAGKTCSLRSAKRRTGATGPGPLWVLKDPTQPALDALGYCTTPLMTSQLRYKSPGSPKHRSKPGPP